MWLKPLVITSELRWCRSFLGVLPINSILHVQWGCEACPEMCQVSFLLADRQVSWVSPIAFAVAFLSSRDGPNGPNGKLLGYLNDLSEWGLGYSWYYFGKMGCSKLTQVSDSVIILNSHGSNLHCLVIHPLNPLNFEHFPNSENINVLYSQLLVFHHRTVRGAS